MTSPMTRTFLPANFGIQFLRAALSIFFHPLKQASAFQAAFHQKTQNMAHGSVAFLDVGGEIRGRNQTQIGHALFGHGAPAPAAESDGGHALRPGLAKPMRTL